MQRSTVIVRVTLIATLVVLAISGIISYKAVQASVAAGQAVTYSTDTLLTLERALSVIRDAETGQRGYLLTRDPTYLDPYHRALSELSERMSQLRASLAADSASTREFNTLERLIKAKTDELAKTIELDQGDHAAAIALVLTNVGNGYMESIRAQIAQMQATQTQALASELREQVSARRRSDSSVLVDRALALALVIILVVVVRQENRRLRLSEEWLAITLRSIGDAVIATDERGAVRMLNAVAEQLTGWRSAEAEKQPLERVFQIVNEETRGIVESPVTKALREGRIVGLANHTVLIRRNRSETPIEDSAAPIRDGAGNIVGVVLVFRDASAERSIERALREADRKKDEFIAVLAHELRNPLAPILQAAKIARTPGVTSEQIRWSHEIIERQAHTMARLLDDLLDVSRITRGTLEVRKSRVPLASIIDGAVETTLPVIEAQRHKLVLDIADEPIELEADPLRMAQVIANLLKNAAKYTDAGGEIRLSARRRGDELTLSVADNGIGLAPEELPRVFDMFVQVKESLIRHEGGLGIGLALAKRLVQLHQGSIEVSSAGLGKGSEFTLRIPCLPQELEATATHTVLASSDERKVSPLRILVADDNRDAAESLAMLLQIDGHDVRVAHDGIQALNVVNSMAPQVAVLDIGMPGLNGYQLVERIRANPQFDRLVLVALTGWGQIQDLERAKAAGFDHHLVKPADPSALRSILNTL